MVNFSLLFCRFQCQFLHYANNSTRIWFESPHTGDRGRRITVSSRPAWSTERVLGQPGLHRENLSWKVKNHHQQQQKEFWFGVYNMVCVAPVNSRVLEGLNMKLPLSCTAFQEKAILPAGDILHIWRDFWCSAEGGVVREGGRCVSIETRRLQEGFSSGC